MRTRKIISLILLILWMTTIFLFSAQSADESSQNSDGIVDRLVEWFVSDFDRLSESEQAQLVDTLTVIVRKGAHMTEFAILAVLILHASYAWELFQAAKWRYFLAWIGSSLYAATDEFHQRFVPGRSGELRDVLIDSLGALIGVLLIGLILQLIRRKRKSAKN